MSSGTGVSGSWYISFSAEEFEQLTTQFVESTINDKITLWVPGNLEGLIRKVHYKINYNPENGKTYISYILDWNKQEGYFGHSFDYEPIIAVLDENKELEQVMYDWGHYEVGRLNKANFKDGKAQLKIEYRTHGYAPVEMINPWLGEDYWEDPTAAQYTPVNLDQEKITLWTDQTLQNMNNDLTAVNSYAWLGLGPGYFLLDQAYTNPEAIGDVFGYYSPNVTQMEVDSTQIYKIYSILELKDRIISTTSTGHLTLEFPNGTLTVPPNTTLVVPAEGFRADLVITRGKVRWKGSKSDQSPTLSDIYGNTIKHVETEFELILDLEEEKTSVYVYDGSIELSDINQAKPVIVSKGEYAYVIAGQIPSEAQKFAREPEETPVSKNAEDKTKSPATPFCCPSFPLSLVIFVGGMLAIKHNRLHRSQFTKGDNGSN